MLFFQVPDVAKRAGVPESTVMLVITGVKGVGTEIEMKVFSAMKQLTYEANKEDINAAGRDTGIIAIVAPAFFSLLFPSQILYGAERKLKQADLKLHQYTTEGNREYETMLLMSVLNDIKPCGLIGVSIKPEKAVLDAYRKKGIPAVLIDEKVEGYSTVSLDNFKGGYIATEYLIKKGRKKIGLVCGMIDREGGYNAEQRYLGYKKALEDGGVAFDKSRVFETSNYIFEDGVQAMQVFHDDRIKLDAIFCATGDTAATGLLKKAADYGIKIPGDIAVIGYDDIDISALTNPPLTTIRQPIVEMGEKAVELVTVFRDKVLKEPQEIKFEPELIKRDSA